MEPNYCLDGLSLWELESQSEIEALRVMALDNSGSQRLASSKFQLTTRSK